MELKTNEQKIAFQKAFFKLADRNIETVRQMMDTLTNTGFYIKDADGRIVAVNRHNCDISGFVDEFEVIGKKSSEIFPEYFAERLVERDRKVRESGKPILRDISSNPMSTNLCSVFPIYGKNGKVVGTMCAISSTMETMKLVETCRRLQPAVDRIMNFVRRTATIEELAKLCGLSVMLFMRDFQKTFGESPTRYSLRMRLNHARIALEETDKSVSTISDECGFFDQSHFGKAFKAMFKMNPSSYRMKHAK